MLLQAIISVSLKALKDFSIGSFNLVVALWMINRCIAYLNAYILAVSLECTAGELGPLVNDNSVRDPKPTDDGLDKLDYKLFVDLDYRGYFRPLGEFVDGDVEVPVAFNGPGE
jgi:hypothetical protein